MIVDRSLLGHRGARGLAERNEPDFAFDLDAVDLPRFVELADRRSAEEAHLASVGKAGSGFGHVEHFFCPVGPVAEDRRISHSAFYTIYRAFWVSCRGDLRLVRCRWSRRSSGAGATCTTVSLPIPGAPCSLARSDYDPGIVTIGTKRDAHEPKAGCGALTLGIAALPRTSGRSQATALSESLERGSRDYDPVLDFPEKWASANSRARAAPRVNRRDRVLVVPGWLTWALLRRVVALRR